MIILPLLTIVNPLLNKEPSFLSIRLPAGEYQRGGIKKLCVHKVHRVFYIEEGYY